MAVSTRGSVKGPYRVWRSVDSDKDSYERPFRISVVLKECHRDGLVPADFKLKSALRLKALEAAQSSFH